MKANETRVLDLLNNASQFVIPIYQRNYSWTEQQCKQLWDDICLAGENEDIKGHFIGSIVYIEEGLSSVSLKSPLLLIDGQQRLTTIILLLVALAEAVGDSEPVKGFSSEKIRNNYLLNVLEKDETRYKLLLSETDKESLLHILEDKEPEPQNPSLTITKNYEFFKELLISKKTYLSVVCKGLIKLLIVDIALNRDHDNPQRIFESMNSTGLALSQADLIRNYLLMDLETEQQEDLYKRYWRPMERSFGQAAYKEHFDSFIRHYLTAKTREISRIKEVYIDFKKYALSDPVRKKGKKAILKDLHTYSGYYCNIVLGKEQDKRLREAFTDMKKLKIDVACPLLMEWYDDYKSGKWSKEDLISATRLVESYIFRRIICALPSNSLNKIFAAFSKNMNKDRYLESVKATFALLASFQRFPRDEEFQREIRVRNLYTTNLRSYWPLRMENFERKERISVEEYSIEHIMPQNENLSAAWRKALGEDWKSIQEQWLHTLGNLTLTGYNSEYGDRSFEKKRDMPGGFRESPLHLNLNTGLGSETVWNEDAIKRRAKRLSEMASKVWPYPDLDPDILQKYRPQILSKDTGYTLENHQHLKKPEIKELFEILRREVLALDPVVHEEILKIYIAFKADSNFVDVIPQAKGLRLILNMTYDDIIDPRKLCKDITDVGSAGNGDVEVFFSKPEDLPYIMGLVQQAFEDQMGKND